MAIESISDHRAALCIAAVTAHDNCGASGRGCEGARSNMSLVAVGSAITRLSSVVTSDAPARHLHHALAGLHEISRGLRHDGPMHPAEKRCLELWCMTSLPEASSSANNSHVKCGAEFRSKVGVGEQGVWRTEHECLTPCEARGAEHEAAHDEPDAAGLQLEVRREQLSLQGYTAGTREDDALVVLQPCGAFDESSGRQKAVQRHRMMTPADSLLISLHAVKRKPQRASV